MGIVRAKEQAGRTRQIDALSGFKRTYTRKWVVESDDPFENPVEISTATDPDTGLSIPSVGDSYPTDERAYVITKSVQQGSTEAERKKWTVTVNYSTLSREQIKTVRFHPFQRPAEVAWSVENYQRPIFKDIDGKAVLNSANQYFDPPPMVDAHRPILVITRAEPSFNGALAQEYVNTINNAVFFGGAAYTVKCSNISSKRVIEEYAAIDGSENEIEYWLTTYEFQYNRDTWRREILDQGRYSLANGKHVPIPEYESDGDEIPDSHVTDPVPLDGSGSRLANPTPDNAVYVTKKVYREVDFSVFNF